MSGITLAFLGTLSVSARGWRPSKDSDAADICLGLVLAMSAVLAAACYKVEHRIENPNRLATAPVEAMRITDLNERAPHS